MILLNIPITTKEMLGSLSVKVHKNEFTRLFKLQICHIHVVLNSDFWIFVIGKMESRFLCLHTKVKHLKITVIIRYLFVSARMPLSFIFSVTEVVCLTILYATPLLSFTYFALRGLCIGLNNYLSKRFFSTYSRLGCAVCILVCGFMSLYFIYHLYMFINFFVDGFFFSI